MVSLDFILVAKVCKVVEYAMHVGIVFFAVLSYINIYTSSRAFSLVFRQYFHIRTAVLACRYSST